MSLPTVLQAYWLPILVSLFIARQLDGFASCECGQCQGMVREKRLALIIGTIIPYAVTGFIVYMDADAWQCIMEKPQ